MAPVRVSGIFLFLFLHASLARSRSVGGISRIVDGLLDDPPESRNLSPTWMEYEFNTGAGNREELVVTDVSIHEQPHLPDTVIDWRSLEVNGTSFLFRAEGSILSMHRVDLENASIGSPVELTARGRILTFKPISPYPEADVVILLYVETSTGTPLDWYRLVDGESFELFWSWPVQQPIRRLKFAKQEGTDTLLLLMDDEENSSILDIYDFSIDFNTDVRQFSSYQRILLPRAVDVQVCFIGEGVSLAVQGGQDIFLYEHRNTTEESILRELQTIESSSIENFVCFESGYLQFLAIAGPNAALYHFEDNEFALDRSFGLSDVAWAKDVRLGTYRDESLLLMQLKNSTVRAFSWHGLGFQKTDLPSGTLDGLDLSMATALPNFGFVHGNRLVKFHVELRDVKHPLQNTTEGLLVLQRLLNESFEQQQTVLDETKALFEKSYLQDPVVTGVWNIETLNVTNATISDDVTFYSVTIGGANLTRDELNLDADSFRHKLEDLKRKLDEIESNSANALDVDPTGLRLDGDTEIHGDINFLGNLNVEDLQVEYLNDIDLARSMDPIEERGTVEDNDEFDYIEAGNLTVRFLNGIPVENIRFADSVASYDHLDFERIRRARVKGHVSFSKINGVLWEKLLDSVVWKNKPMLVRGNTVVEGTVIADNVALTTLNNLRYPEDYVLTNSDSTAVVSGIKSFDALSASRLENVSTLNGIDFEDFVILHKDNVLKKEITFKNLIIEGSFQVDGEITGLNMKKEKLLNETTKISSDVLFSKLNVLGNVTFNNLLMDKLPLNLNDLLQKNEENVEITGTKTFLGNVDMRANVTITSGLINGHLLNEFVTLDTDQDFPNLIHISPNVSFGNVAFGGVEKLEAILNTSGNSTDCLDKIILFKSPITVDRLSFGRLNNAVSFKRFARKLNETFRHVLSDHDLTVEDLFAEEIVAKTVNGMDPADLADRSRVLDELFIDHLETDQLNASFVNGMSLDEINQLREKITTITETLASGNVTLDRIKVAGSIQVNSINGIAISDLLGGNGTVTKVFKDPVSVRRLTVLGSVNGYNISERVSDIALKTDTDIRIDGYKMFENINCHVLNVTSLNDHPVDNILDASKEQVLTGPLVVDGSVTVSRTFNATGKIGSVPYRDLTRSVESLGKNTFQYRGNVKFSNNASVENLYANGFIREKNLDSFLQSVIRKSEDNVTVSGTKVFENLVVFNDAFVVRDKLNDIDLRGFHDRAVFVDEPFSVETRIVFKDGIKVDGDLIVGSTLDAKSIADVDVDELRRAVLYLNRPSYIDGITTIADATLLSGVRVETFNDLDTNLLIPLHTEQNITVDSLKCRNVTADRLKISGLVNGENFKRILENTFTVTGDQNLTGHFRFHGDVRVRGNFDPRLINGVDPTKFVPLNSKDSIVGNLSFADPVYLDGNLRLLGYLNGVDPARWEAVAVTANNSIRQIISGRWTVTGNVSFEKGARGSQLLNGINVTDAVNTLALKSAEMHAALAEKNANLRSVCEDLTRLRHDAEHQIYRLGAFDYLQVMDFDRVVRSAHHFEIDDADYLMVSFNDTCNVHVYLFDGRRFQLAANVPDFGAIDRWTTFRQNRTLYFLVTGSVSCGRGPVNLWSLRDGEFQHALDLGDNVDVGEISPHAFSMLLERNDRMRSAAGAREELRKHLSTLAKDDEVRIVLEKDRAPSTGNPAVTSRRNAIGSAEGRVGKPETLHFRAGLLGKEMFLYYDEQLSEDRIFICSNGGTRWKILQTIEARRPTCFAVLNVEGSIETILIFVENGKILRIYEYKGIQGFAYRDSIGMNVDRLASFKIRKYVNLARRHCLALIRRNRLTILEARMHGEKLDMKEPTCLEQ